jgi:hypothetical protein
MIFWLMLYTTVGQPVHVGNYSTLATCETAAKQAVLINPFAPKVGALFMGLCACRPTMEPPNPHQ